MKVLYACLLLLISPYSFSQSISIVVNATQGHKPISPWIYGKNNNLSNASSSPVTAATWKKYKDAGLRLYRENGGNNATKYNWRLKLSSHPDWYNNVYDSDWNYSATSLLSNTSNTQGMYAFQLLGKVASNKNNNFNDWAYNGSSWWSGVGNNWAGGGGPSSVGGNNGDGNPELYLQNCTADSTVKILDHWFSTLQLDPNRLRYWNMDNEPEIWNGTHDDVVGNISAEEFMQKYFAVAKAARSKFPDIKLTGPVSPNEWQWYNWNNSKVTDPNDGKSYCWIEYFIKRISEEQSATGIRLLDVLDFHFYPSTANDPDLTLQLHRIWYDTQWDYPGANGVKVTDPSGWNNAITKEYFFERCNQWLTQYLGANHGVSLGISEYGTIANNGSENANVIACWYASHLGTFANNGVEFFTPWDWYSGQWEVMHLFSNYFGTISTLTTSSNDAVLSGYSSISSDGDSLMIVLVNRDRLNSRTANISLQNFTPSASMVNGFELSSLPTAETFVSHVDNALQAKQYTVAGNALSIGVPALSVTLIQIPTNSVVTSTMQQATSHASFELFPNPSSQRFTIKTNNMDICQVVVKNILGETMCVLVLNETAEVDMSAFPSGSYVVQVIHNGTVLTQKMVKE